MPGNLQKVIDAIDRANAADPSGKALVYGQRMSVELVRMFPDASELLQIAARGQHVERWLLPRSDYPAGKAGYLGWRREQGQRHATRISAMMEIAGYGDEACSRIGALLRKEGLKRDTDVQALEDVICFVFLRWYFSDFARDRDEASLIDILTKTARKMSAAARVAALEEFSLPEPLAAAVRAA